MENAVPEKWMLNVILKYKCKSYFFFVPFWARLAAKLQKG
jgi:hypothetical protein